MICTCVYWLGLGAATHGLHAMHDPRVLLANMNRNLANNELLSLPYDAFELLHVDCIINITANTCAQQPCGTGQQWYQAKQGVEFCALTSPHVVSSGSGSSSGSSSDSGGPSNSSDPGNAAIPQADDDFPGALLAIVVIEVVLLCAALAWLFGCRFRSTSRDVAGPTKSLSDEELAAPPLTLSPMQPRQASN